MPCHYQRNLTFSSKGAEFKLLRLLGSGTTAEVWLAQKTRSGAVPLVSSRVCKFIDPTLDDRAGAESKLRNELHNSSSHNRQHLRSVYGLHRYADHSWLEMQHVRGCTLDKYLASLDASAHSQDEQLSRRLNMAKNTLPYIAAAIDRLYEEHGVIHRDIKPSHILIEKNKHITLLGLGASYDTREAQGLESNDHSKLGTPQYKAPETYLAHRPSRQIDVFSLACLAHEILFGEAPQRGPRREAITADLLRQQYNKHVNLKQLRALHIALSASPAHRQKTAQAFSEAFATSSIKSVPTPRKLPTKSSSPKIRAIAPELLPINREYGERPPPKGGGFVLRLKPDRSAIRRTAVATQL